VAAALGHKDINTTARHYAKSDDEMRRKASKHVRLRKEM
jgi:integrase